MSRTYRELLRSAPLESALLSVGPLVVAVGQLLNSYFNGTSLSASVAFAVALFAFAVVATGHQAAIHRLRQLERNV